MPASPPEDTPRLRRLAAAAVLQRVRWGERTVDVPLAHPIRVDPDEFVLCLADGTWVLLVTAPDAATVRAGLRRWIRELGEGAILVLVDTPPDVAETLRTTPPDRPARRISVVLLGAGTALWDGDVPPLVDVLHDAADHRPPPPPTVLDALRARIDQTWPKRVSPPSTTPFEQIVGALAQTHALVRRVRGEARLELRIGGHVIVLAGSGDPDIDDPALASGIARAAAALATTDADPGLVVVGGPDDLLARVEAVLGKAARRGWVNRIDPDGAVTPADRELAEVAALAFDDDVAPDLWAPLETGLARSRGTTFAADLERAGRERLGVVANLIDARPGARLDWMAPERAELRVGDRLVQLRWVGPEGGRPERAVRAWRMAALAGRWTGLETDLILVGGDAGTWAEIQRALPASPEGHLFHLDRSGTVRAKAGLLGRFGPMARALRAHANKPEAERGASVERLRAGLHQRALREVAEQQSVADFARKLQASSPWATRLLLGSLIVVYALQWRWDGTSGVVAVRMGALTGEGLFLGEPWRWLSAAALHGAWWHIALNGFALWILGKRLEALLGPERMVLLFLVSCVGGSMLHEAFSTSGDLAVGASTGILGLLAAQGALALFRRDLFPERVRKLLWREAWTNGLLILGLSLLPFVGGLAHLGGALAGFAAVATGLLTLGVAPGGLGGPLTRVARPVGLQGAAWAAAAVAVACVAVAFAIGQPWTMAGDQKQVRDTVLEDAGLTVPLPPTAQARVVETTDDGPLRRSISAGEPLRDGLRVEVRAVHHGVEQPDLDDLIALYAPGEAWQRARTPTGRVVQTPVASVEGSGRLVRRRWMLSQNGVLVDMTVTALPGVVPDQLAGTWNRLPAGVHVDAEGWADAGRGGSAPAALAAVRDGRVPTPPVDDPVLQGLLAGSAHHVGGDPDRARDAWREPLQSVEGRAQALSLAAALPKATALTLLEHTLSFAGDGSDDADKVRITLAQAYEEAGRWDDALEALEPIDRGGALDLFRAQAHWHAGRTDSASALARAWWSAAEPWWTRPLRVGMMAMGAVERAGFRTNRGWARFLSGDARGCRMDSQAAVDLDPDAVVAAFNLGLCTLAVDGADAARPVYNEALARSREIGGTATIEAALKDLQTARSQGMEGAGEMVALLEGAIVRGRRPATGAAQDGIDGQGARDGLEGASGDASGADATDTAAP